MTRVAAILKSLQWTLRVISQSPNPAIQALREKFGFVGNTPSNVETILHQLKTNEFFREFRQGDVTLECWDCMRSTGERLKQALGFLYY